MILEKSFTPLYKLFPISFPRMDDRHNPRINASTTAESVSITGCREMEKNGSRDTSAVAAI